MKISVIVPFADAGLGFVLCLEGVARARAACVDLAQTELIAVDDGAADGSAALAERCGAIVARTEGRQGPAAARNLGAHSAGGDVLFFVDSDVVLHSDALRLAAEALGAEPALSACFGSYDDSPADAGLLSQYMNLRHHYVHQQAREEAATFWSGCGALRAADFRALGGFDARTYRRPSIEDIDLGYRIRRRGGHIRLLKEMQATHLKRWTLPSILRSDILDRGIPWTRLLWREARDRRALGPLSGEHLDLNLEASNRWSVVCAGLVLLCLLAAPWLPAAGPAAPALALVLLTLNRGLYAFFLRRRGLLFTLGAIPMHWLYYLYNSLSFGLGTLLFFWRGVQPVNADGSLGGRAPEA